MAVILHQSKVIFRRLSRPLVSFTQSPLAVQLAVPYTTDPRSRMTAREQDALIATEPLQKEAEHLSNGTVAVNQWSQQGAACDFRSERRQRCTKC